MDQGERALAKYFANAEDFATFDQKQTPKIEGQFLFIITLGILQRLLQWGERKRWQDDWLRHPDET